MDMDRRKFLKLCGLTALGLGVFKADNIYAQVKSGMELGKKDKNKRWAMVVDTRKCDDSCTDCITACHLTHNVPEIDTAKDEIKWIWQEKFHSAFPDQSSTYISDSVARRPFPVLCNHCDNPACVRVCPTQATFKRADGVVMMDYHRCIGCRYCMAGCPYGARSFNFKDPRPYIKTTNPAFPTRTKGVVEKCNFCEERLKKDLPPACVAACQKGVLVFGDLNDPQSEVRELLRQNPSLQRKPALGTFPSVFYIV